MEFNLTTIFDDFYHTRFFVLVCLNVFTILLSLRLDETIKLSYWLVFLPLWIWKLTAFLGMVVGTITWFRLSRRRYDREMFIQFKSMLISYLTNLFLFMFEVIVCDKLESERQISWSVCFIPMYILSLISIGTSIWSIRYNRSYEIELFCSLNILQFVFIALRLDLIVLWSWVLVLIPIWICMSIGLIVLIYIIILTIIIKRNNNLTILSQHIQAGNTRPKQTKWSNVVLYVLFLFSLLTFEILLVNKLDNEISLTSPSSNLAQHFQSFFNNPQQQQQHHQFASYQFPNLIINNNFYNNNPNVKSNSLNQNYKQQYLSYFVTCIPLFVSYLSLILLSFNNHTGNVWWFGIRRDLCGFILELIPFLRVYGNIQIKNKPTQIDECDLTNSLSQEQTRNLILNQANSNQNRSNEISSISTYLNSNNHGSNQNYISLSLLNNQSSNTEQDDSSTDASTTVKRIFFFKKTKTKSLKRCSKNNNSNKAQFTSKKLPIQLDIPD